MAKPIKIEILGDTSGLEKAVDSASKKLGHIGDAVKKAGTVVAAGIGAAAAGVVAFGVKSVQGMIETEKVAAQTRAVIKSMGDVANVSAEDVDKLSASIQSMSGLSGDAVQHAANLLLTFGNVKNEVGEGNDIFTRTTYLMADMATAMGSDVSSSAIQLGKALNDPIAGVGALSEVGVSFTQEQKEMIKTLVESGNVLDAQKIILSELDKQFGGSAKAFGETTAGKVERMKRAFEEFGKALVVRVLPVISSLATWAMDKVIPALERWGRVVTDKVVPAIGDLIDRYLRPLVERVVPVVRDWFDKLTKGGEDLTPVIGALAGVLGLAAVAAAGWAASMAAAAAPVVLVIGAVAALGAGLVYAWRNWDGFREVVQKVVAWFKDTAWPEIKRVAEALGPMFSAAFEAVKAVIAKVVEVIRKIWDGWGSDLIGTVKRSFDALMDVIHGVIETLTGIFELIKAILTGKWGEAWDAVKQIFSGAWEAVLGVLRVAGNAIEAALTGVRTVIAAAFTAAWHAAKTAVIDGWNHLSDWLSKVPDKLHALASGWFDAGKDMGKKILDGIVQGLKSTAGFVADFAEAVKNALIDGANWVIDKMNDAIPNKIEIPGPIPDINLPDNPFPRIRRAMGGPAEGWTWVGERGPEAVWLPRGSQVRAAHESSPAVGGVVVNVQTNADPFAIADAVAWTLRTSGR
jgi:phage-related protein